MTYPPHSSPGAAEDPWTTPARPPGPVVSPIVPTHKVAPGGQPIEFPGDADPGGRDDVAASVAGAIAAAEARYREHEGDTYAQGSTIGDLLDLPAVPGEQSKHTGGSDAGYPS
jgi:hypothetical protein